MTITTKMSGTQNHLRPNTYTSAAEIRERVTSLMAQPSRKLSPKQLEAAGVNVEAATKAALNQKTMSEGQKREIADKWIDSLIESARKHSRLMTDIQLADWRLVRKLVTGDRVRYIGPDREEVTQANLIVPRPFGQSGIITSVLETDEGRVITFSPDEAIAPLNAPEAERQIVELQVKEYTAGWLMLERIP